MVEDVLEGCAQRDSQTPSQTDSSDWRPKQSQRNIKYEAYTLQMSDVQTYATSDCWMQSRYGGAYRQ